MRLQFARSGARFSWLADYPTFRPSAFLDRPFRRLRSVGQRRRITCGKALFKALGQIVFSVLARRFLFLLERFYRRRFGFCRGCLFRWRLLCRRLRCRSLRGSGFLHAISAFGLCRLRICGKFPFRLDPVPFMMPVGSSFPLPYCARFFTDCGFAVMAHNGPPSSCCTGFIVPLKKQKRPEFVPQRPITKEHFRVKGNRRRLRIVCPAETRRRQFHDQPAKTEIRTARHPR